MTRKVRFSGFQVGDTVTLSASQGGVTRGPNTVSAWRTLMGDPWTGDAISETLTVTVEEEIPDGPQFAPLAVEWRIKVSGSTYGDTPAYWDADDSGPGFEAFDHTYQKVQYVVHTGDSGNYRNTWVGHSSHRNKAFQYGQNPGHVYSEPGTYSIGVYVYDDDGKWGVWTRSSDLVVTNPDDEFDAASTILLASDGDYTGAPHADTVPAANKVTTFDAAVARFNTIKGWSEVAGGVRICAKAGDSFNEVSRQVTCSDPASGRLLVDTFGGTAQAEYSERNQNVVNSSPDDNRLFGYFGGWAWTIKNWKFDMGFDVASNSPTAPNGWPNANTRILFYHGEEDRNDIAGMTGARFVYDNVDVTGCGATVISNVTSAWDNRRSGTFLNDCDFYDNADYVVYNTSSFFALGTRLMETYGNDLGMMARTRLMGTARGYRAHPILLRDTSGRSIYLRACYVEARGGWSGQGQETMYAGGQSLLRIYNQTETSLSPRPDGSIVGRGKRVYICDSILTGNINVDSENADSNGTHVVIENCLLVDDPASWTTQVLNYAGGRKTFRNNVFLSLNVPQDPGQSGKNLSKFETQPPRIGRFRGFISTSLLDFTENQRMENLHNTFVMLRTTANLETGDFYTRSDISTPGDVATTYDLVEGNNVVYAPNVNTPVGPTMDTIDLPAGVRILDVWMTGIWERQTHTLSSALADGATSPAIPYPNDWYNNPTTGADYSGSSGLNGVRSDGNDYAQIAAGYVNDPSEPSGGADALTIIHDCDASGVVQGDGTGTHFRIENRSGAEWPAGEIVILLDRGTTAMTPDRLHEVDQSEFKLYRPTSAQSLDAGVKSSLFDFQRNLRPNAGYAISPSSGTNGAGAILSAA